MKITLNLTLTIEADDATLLKLSTSESAGLSLADLIAMAADHSKTENEQPAKPGQSLLDYSCNFTKSGAMFDESLSLDTPSGEFMGECGVTAYNDGLEYFEVWLFDKADIKTVTEVLTTKPNTEGDSLARLSIKGKVNEISDGSILTLESQTIRLEVTVTNVELDGASIKKATFGLKATLK
jgi:hypothetical protein